MTDRDERAVVLHHEGFNCAQSVLTSCCDLTGMDKKTSLAVSGGFGGGVRCREICGAVSGGIMALGLAFPYNDKQDAAAKEKIAALTVEFCDRFREKFGSVVCGALLDSTAPEKLCDEYIKYGALLAEAIIAKNK